MTLGSADREALRALLAAPDAALAALQRIAPLDPARDFRGGSWGGVDFSGDDLSGYDFSGADVTDADFSRATGLSGRGAAIFDGCTGVETARWPP
jgi:uncharacterized protein YjbI with pentapeptide repeats